MGLLDVICVHARVRQTVEPGSVRLLTIKLPWRAPSPILRWRGLVLPDSGARARNVS